MTTTLRTHGTVAKKKPGKKKQFNVRMSADLLDRLEQAADMLALSSSDLLRMLVVENLPAYEQRGREAHGLTEKASGDR